MTISWISAMQKSFRHAFHACAARLESESEIARNRGGTARGSHVPSCATNHRRSCFVPLGSILLNSKGKGRTSIHRRVRPWLWSLRQFSSTSVHVIRSRVETGASFRRWTITTIRAGVTFFFFFRRRCWSNLRGSLTISEGHQRFYPSIRGCWFDR